MIVVMSPLATKENLQDVIKKLESLNLRTHLSTGDERTIVGVIGDKKIIANLEMEMMAGVEKTVRITEKYKLVSRDFHPQDTVIDVDGVEIGGKEIILPAPSRKPVQKFCAAAPTNRVLRPTISRGSARKA